MKEVYSEGHIVYIFVPLIETNEMHSFLVPVPANLCFNNSTPLSTTMDVCAFTPALDRLLNNPFPHFLVLGFLVFLTPTPAIFMNPDNTSPIISSPLILGLSPRFFLFLDLSVVFFQQSHALIYVNWTILHIIFFQLLL